MKQSPKLSNIAGVQHPPHIAIAILNFNGHHFFEQFLPSVNCLNYPNFSIWVIDNASTDNSIGFLKQHYPEIKIIQNNQNAGYAAGYNLGLAQIEADFYLLLNSDVQLTPGMLEPLAEQMKQSPSLAAIQPKILSYNQPHLFEYAGAGGGLIDWLGYPFCRGRILDTVEEDREQFNSNESVFWASGAAMLVRRQAFEQLGGFYPYFFMHNEEIDWCWRAQNLGWDIGYNGNAVVYHLGGGSLSKESPRKTYLNFRNNLVMNTRNQPRLHLLWCLPIRGVLDWVAGIKFLLDGNPRNSAAVAKAWWHFLVWCVKPSPNKWPQKRGWGKGTGVYRGSIIWQYYVRGKKKFPF